MLDSGGGACSQSVNSAPIDASCVQCGLMNAAVAGLAGEDSPVGSALQMMVAMIEGHASQGSSGGWKNPVSLLQQAMDGKEDAVAAARAYLDAAHAPSSPQASA